jgi:hypothetical protein
VIPLAETEYLQDEGNDGGSGRFNVLSLLPGGERPGNVEIATALLVLGALGYLILVRRGFRGVIAS